jgi:hypothetical protein
VFSSGTSSHGSGTGGLAAAFAHTGSNPASTTTGALSSPTTGTGSVSPSESSGSNSEPRASASSEALVTLNRYWSDIRDHGFAAAYGYLAPGAAGKSESQFIASEEEAGVRNAQFHGNVVTSTGSSATVAVESLRTEDSQFGCRHWTGTYTLGRNGGGWLIQRAQLTPHSC